MKSVALQRGRRGFTLVELLIVIAVIAILASITIVAYNGVQRRAVETTMKSDLSNAGSMFELVKAQDGLYPSELPAEVKSSPGVTLTLVTNTLPHYSGLSSVQQGVLFQTVCAQLVSEGYGVGTNNGGQSEQYITGCNVYGYAAMQINGWNAHDFNVPIDATTAHEWYNNHISYDSYRPNHKATVLTFADELSSRYTAMGGTFPVTSFWDPWASPGNCVLKQDLPEPDGSSEGASYCVQATSSKYPGAVWHVSPGKVIASGAC